LWILFASADVQSGDTLKAEEEVQKQPKVCPSKQNFAAPKSTEIS
jgi:hypothetical protein